MDDARFEAAWGAYCPALTRYCKFATGSNQDGEDVAAEVFSRLLTTRRPIPDPKIEAWLFTVAHNLCMSHHRARGTQRKLVARLSDHPPDTLGDAWRDPELWDAVRDLDERSRLVVYLRVVEDRPFAQVADIVGVSEGAAKMTYYRAMERLRVALGAGRQARAEAFAGGVADAD